MKMNLRHISVFFCLLCYSFSAAQQTAFSDSVLTYSLELQAAASSGKMAPFWLHTNRAGSVSAQPYSGNLVLGAQKTMHSEPAEFTFKKGQKLFDYGFGLKMIGQVDNQGFHFLPHAYYATGRLWIFDATIGCREQILGNQDMDLSSGGILFSGNARPLPAISIGISKFRPFPYTQGLIEIKGGISHGWFLDNVYIKNELLHYKFVGVRAGGCWPINVSYESHHAAQWGGISPVYGVLGTSWNDFAHIFLAKNGGTMANDQMNAQGNHIGSQQMAFDFKLNGWQLHAYWQTIFEDAPIDVPWKSVNLPDGLWGVAISQNHWPYISKVLFEYLNTTDQSGPVHDVDGLVLGGDDSYFSNSVYRNGWTYYAQTIGTPFITSPICDANNNIYIQNDRVRVFHTGVMGDIYGYRYKMLISHSQNYGTYQNPIAMQKNTALLFEVQKHFAKAWNLDFSLAVAADVGSQFGNSMGVLFSVKKSGIIARLKK